jgi:hypothetical protein
MLYGMEGDFNGAASGTSVIGAGPLNATGLTLFIPGQDWGVYRSTAWTGFYGMPSDAYSSWSANVAGRALFGMFKNSSGDWQFDKGGFLIPVTGTLTDGIVKGFGTGVFQTMTKMGTITADVLGIYNTGNVSPDTAYGWQGQTGGVWEKTADLTFSSRLDGGAMRFVGQFSGLSSDGKTEYRFFGDSNYHAWIRYINGTVETKIDYSTDLRPFSTPMWNKFTYDNTSPGSFSYYSRGTDGYPDSFTDAFFRDIATANSWSDPGSSSPTYAFNSDSDFSARMGGTGDLWSATSTSPVTTCFLGGYENWSGLPQIFGADLVSENVKNSSYTTLDGGAYKGYIGGMEMNGAIEGKSYAIYIAPLAPGSTTYDTGVLVGNFAGTVYPEVDMWQGTGGMYPVKFETTSTAPVDLVSHVSSVSYMGSSNDAEFNVLSVSVNGSPVSLANNPYAFQGEFALFDEGWGVRQHATGASYAGWTIFEAASGDWSASLEYRNAPANQNATLIMGEEAAGAYDATHKITGSSVGYGAFVDTTGNTTTWISVGEVLGSFNPDVETFQTGTMGVGLTTWKYLAMQSGDATAKAALDALNIPAVQVGTATLSWTGEANGLTSVAMNNVGFFATSTGQAPSIWATGSVGGTYNSTPVPGGAAVTLSGNGLSANFGIVNWNAANNVWAAQVSNGAGTLSGGTYTENITFKGVAAGAITSGSAFSGTAAGVAAAAASAP